MKQKYLLALLFCFSQFMVSAQESILQDMDNALLEKYISLAKQNYPRKRGFEAKVERAKAVVNTAKLSWFDIFNAGYYYRPENSTGTAGGNVTPTGQLITSGFLFGASINLGLFLAKPSIIKAAKADYKLAKADDEEYDGTLTNEVRNRYYAYLLAKRTLEIRNTAAQNLRGVMATVKTKYERAEIPIDTYTAARNAATEADATALAAEVDLLKSKNALEEIIGAKIETVK